MAHKSLVTVRESWREMQNISDMSQKDKRRYK